MVDQDAKPTGRAGLEVFDHTAHMIEAVESFDHNADIAQIVAPYMLNQFGVVHAFHQDAAGIGNLRLSIGAGNRSGRRHSRTPLWCRLRSHERDRLSFQQEPAGLETEVTVRPMSIPQRDGLNRDLHDVAAETRSPILDDQANRSIDGRDVRPSMDRFVQNVAVVCHLARLGRCLARIGDSAPDRHRRFAFDGRRLSLRGRLRGTERTAGLDQNPLHAGRPGPGLPTDDPGKRCQYKGANE